MHFSLSQIKFTFWTVIHPVPPMGSTAVLKHQQMALPHLLVTQNTRNLPTLPSWAHILRHIWLSGAGEWDGPCAGTWWGLTLGLGTGWEEGQANFMVAHTLWFETWSRRPWHFVPFNWLYEMTLSGIVSVSKNLQMVLIHLLTLKSLPM